MKAVSDVPRLVFLLIAITSFAFVVVVVEGGTTTFTYSPTADGYITESNPLRGMVPYSSAHSTADMFPHSLENFYVPFNRILYNWGVYNWTDVENELDAITGRGHHAIWRVYLDFPGSTKNPSDAVPAFLIPGLKFNLYPTPSSGGIAPDYTNTTLITAIVQTIGAMAARYDGDRRIAVIQVGFLGHWGEWHMAPNNTLFPTASIQDQVLTAFRNGFNKTQINTRYPWKIGTYTIPNLRMGFHDDSYAQDTLIGYGIGSFWNTLSGLNGSDVYKNYIIGGELRPEFWPCIFAANITSACAAVTTLPNPQDWTQCTQLVRPSYMWNAYAFRPPGYQGDDLTRARAGALLLGYRYTVRSIAVVQQGIDSTHTSFELHVTMANLGLAPFYYPLYIQLNLTYKLRNSTSTIDYTLTDTNDLRSLLPGVDTTYIISVPNEISSTGNPDPSNVESIGGELLLTSWILLPSQKILFDIADNSAAGAVNGSITVPMTALESSNSASPASRLCSFWF